jgi:lipoprotein-anchoring transpeptidase ErfK/SrfK
VLLRANVERGERGVSVDTVVSVRSRRGTLSDVDVYYGARSADTRLPGRLSKDATSWTAAELLEPGRRYVVRARGEAAAGGERATKQWSFTTQALSSEQEAYASIAPLQGETVGVGMPVIVWFDAPVSDQASIERHLAVTSQPAVRGTWHWVSAYEVHYRPRAFWPAGAQVRVDADINGVDAGNGVYGQEDRHISFAVGDSVVSRANVDTHQMKVYINGSLVRTIPISAGAPGNETRGGTKIIMEKFVSKRMDAATTGVSPDDPGYYNIPDVPYAMRVTYSGEFLHGAPWSVASQGLENVSHGCIGMSVENAQWLFEQSHRGDVVEVIGSDRPLEANNGWTDWNQSFAEYRQASALT